MSDMLIKGMKMPESCRECPCAVGVSEDGEERWYGCKINYQIKQIIGIPYHERPSDCPLIELPPHGDLIDINNLKISILKHSFTDNAKADLMTMFREINTAPTIIPADKGGEE